jgi:hypothetical protein
MSNELTPEQMQRLQAALNAAYARIKTGTLAQTSTNGARVLLEVKRLRPTPTGADVTSGELYDAITRIADDLDWTTPPAAVAARKAARERQLPAAAAKGAEDFTARSKAADAAQLKRKADEKIVAETFIEIGKYFPTRGGRLLQGKQSELQTLLVSYVKSQVAVNADRESIRQRVRERIESEYSKLERSENPVVQ